MKITENVTRYECDFCKKRLYVKHAMEKHEDLCNSNPKNISICYCCVHLEQIQKEVWFEYGNSEYGCGDMKEVSVFRCSKLDKLMFPWSIERKDLHNRYPETYDEQEPMPKSCNDFKDNLEHII